MGTGFKGDTETQHSISDNISLLKSKYPYSNGYFGDKGQGRSHTRNITGTNSVETATCFYDIASKGGIETLRPGLRYSKMADGTIISYREISKSDGTAVVEINIKHSTDSCGLKYQKIHFIEGDNK